jgi:hypothetical protein
MMKIKGETMVFTKVVTRTLACALLLAGAVARGQDAPPEVSRSGQPRSWEIRAEPYANTGYGAARWGMSEAEVRKAIAATWPDALAGARVAGNQRTRTVALAIRVPSLPPGPGPAEISYVFGASGKGLAAVHLTWTVAGNPLEAARAPLLQAATQLAAGLMSYQWQDFGVTRGLVLAPGELLLFAGRDDHGGGVEIRLGGMPFDVEIAGPAPRQEHRAPPPGPALLRQSFAASIDRPDIYRIPAGAF